MPKAPKCRLAGRLIHPQSRKAAQIARQRHHGMRIDKSVLEKGKKLELLGTKLKWFQEHLEPEKTQYTTAEAGRLVEQYFHRFDEELEQIDLINSVGSRKGMQHSSRRDAIQMTIDRDRTECKNGAFEIPDIINGKNLKLFRNWTGEMRYAQNIKMRKFKPTSDSTKLAEESSEDCKSSASENIKDAVSEKSNQLSDKKLLFSKPDFEPMDFDCKSENS